MISYYGGYRQVKFADTYPDADAFVGDVEAMFPEISGVISQASISLTWKLLIAFYANSTIASSDTNQFKMKLFSIIYMYAPAWQKRREIQEALIGLNEADLREGYQNIMNQALNDGSVLREDDEVIKAINQQSRSWSKKDKLGAYAALAEVLRADVTREYVDKFKKLFLTIVTPELPLYYVTNEEEEIES